jgi:3-deoxy-D-manno-octulosonate 8-phosphate phosphatase (KDO 8-P phosphatase)
MMSDGLSQRCAAIELLLLDVDGVLTDGGIMYGDDGLECKVFHVRDGSGLKIWHHAGKRSAIISGRSSRVVEVRAAELGICCVLQGAGDKGPAYQRVLRELNVRPEQVCFVGDDVPDLPILYNCGLAVAVADACTEVRTDAHYVSRAAGGRGAVRETIELILRCQNRWQTVVDSYRNQRVLDS